MLNITHRLSGYIVGNMWMPQSLGGIPCSDNLRSRQARFVNGDGSYREILESVLMENEFKRYYAADGSNVGGAIVNIIKEVQQAQEKFLAIHNHTLESAKLLSDKEKDELNKKYKTWVKRDSYMTNTQHTPGPWRIGDAGQTVFGPKTDKPAPVMVATMEKAGGAYKANARLIAAAPELLEALKNLLDREKYGVIKGIKEAHAAIAKAEGGAQ